MLNERMTLADSPLKDFFSNWNETKNEFKYQMLPISYANIANNCELVKVKFYVKIILAQ
jgi:hypothetical protein